MAMKLLSPTEVKDQKAQDQTRDIIRTQEIKDALNSANKMFARAQTDFNDMLARNRETWAQEEARHVTRVTEMAKEIEILEARREKALEPIEEMMKQAQEELKKGLTLIVKNEAWSATLSDTEERLEEKLSEVGEREVDVSWREDQVLIKEDATKVQIGITQRGIMALEQSQKEFESYKEQENMVIIRRKEELRLEEINLIAREHKIQRDVDAINKAQLIINDARGVIEREYKRLNIPA